MNRIPQYLSDAGFVHADMKKDFGDLSLAKHVLYVMRKDVYLEHSRFEYFMVISYEGNVVEVVGEVYLAEKNTFKPKGNLNKEELEKRGHLPVKLAILRSYDEVLKFLAQ